MKRIVLAGASGSIGQQTIDVVLHHRDAFTIVAVSVGHNIAALHGIIAQLSDLRMVCVAEQSDAQMLQQTYHPLFSAGEKKVCYR